MNFYDAMMEQLKKHGLFPNQAEEIMQKVMDENETMKGRWYERTASYPENMIPILWMSVKDVAYKWIVENCPEAWFRPLFEFSPKELEKKIKEKNNK